MPEMITAISEYEYADDAWAAEAGYKIITDQQTIILAIDDRASCCESWGYFLTEDDTEKFVGAHLLGIKITDTNRSNRQFTAGSWNKEIEEGKVEQWLDDGDVMFVDIQTDRGTLQFVAYNAHNGYYGHEARVTSTQLTESRTL